MEINAVVTATQPPTPAAGRSGLILLNVLRPLFCALTLG